MSDSSPPCGVPVAPLFFRQLWEKTEMIHYHGLPMWPMSDMPRAFAARHGMVSFEHPDQIEIATEVCQSVVLDNGAFSAWKSGKKHDFAGYLAWVTKWLKHPAVEWCVIPDVIDGTEGQNDMILHSWPHGILGGVPVYHMHESLERLERLVKRYPRVALGSSGAFATIGTTEWWGRMAEMMKVACDAEGMPKTKLHGLRMLDPVIFSHLPLSSADSCNVARNVGIDAKWNGPYAPVYWRCATQFGVDWMNGNQAGAALSPARITRRSGASLPNIPNFPSAKEGNAGT